jgi:hypothetical protein
MKSGTSWGGILLRVGFAVALVVVSYNPSGWSYCHWATSDLDGFGPAKGLAGALLLCAWVLYLRAALHALGKLGVALAVLVVAALVWLLTSWGWLDPQQPTVFAWVALVALGLVLGVGLSWSIVRRRLTGQVDVEESPV